MERDEKPQTIQRCPSCGREVGRWHSSGICWGCYNRHYAPPVIRRFVPAPKKPPEDPWE